MYKVYQKTKLSEKLMSVCIHNCKIYVGGTNKTLYEYDFNLQKRKELFKFNKSIRDISQNQDLLAAVSYDGTGAVFKNGKLFDNIEGPETEVKSVAFCDDNSCIALSTRGKQVWILSIEDIIEVDSILEEHTADVKGVKFYDERLFSYGYDNSIKMYEKAMYGDENYELIQNITDHSSTVWSLLLVEDKMFSCDHDGNIFRYKMNSNEFYDFDTSFKASLYPIYKIIQVGENLLAYICNKFTISIIDFDGNFVVNISDIHDEDINCLDYDSKNKILISCGDDGFINLIKLEI
ncbi:hypothetical protein EDEG_01575 [Edhazardia aedis USNM 41457]|uniref:Anaphase-promoting complex subunit 4 WD40 domain-containing protein n=1 Tax=Edhazardia aedis (strain USNM 41457) TaxID=1003232 RepID=J9D9H0_EDHAE|nr:hypothetical protein EDEG_01575 [Edhazardia aedis USNM 41457]|eukprot:EJW04139.1 hypothetical protein EDEG_01575 [Edhazardia aedis USNM 41457]